MRVKSICLMISGQPERWSQTVDCLRRPHASKINLPYDFRPARAVESDGGLKHLSVTVG